MFESMFEGPYCFFVFAEGKQGQSPLVVRMGMFGHVLNCLIAGFNRPGIVFQPEQCQPFFIRGFRIRRIEAE